MKRGGSARAAADSRPRGSPEKNELGRCKVRAGGRTHVLNAMLLPFALSTLTLHAFAIWGGSACPTPAEVQARFTDTSGPVIEFELSQTSIILHRDDGQAVAVRPLPRGSTCADLAAATATALVSISNDPRIVPLRHPLAVTGFSPPPVERATELDVGASVGWLTGASSAEASGGAQLIVAPRGGPLTAAIAVAATGPLRLAFSPSAEGIDTVELSIAAGAGLRGRFGVFSIDLLMLVPLSVVLPIGRQSLLPLELAPSPQEVLSLQPGIRLAAWESRFAPYLKVAVDVPVVHTGQIADPPMTVTIAVGVGWSPL